MFALAPSPKRLPVVRRLDHECDRAVRDGTALGIGAIGGAGPVLGGFSAGWALNTISRAYGDRDVIRCASVLLFMGGTIAARAPVLAVPACGIAGSTVRFLAVLRTYGGGVILLAGIPRCPRSIGGLLGLALLFWGSLVVGPSVARAARVATPARSLEMTALFAEPSYSPGQVARLRVAADATRLTVQPIAGFSRSANPYALIANDPAVGPARTVGWRPGAGTVIVRIGRWASGVYFVRVRSASGQVVAPVIVRLAHLGGAPVAVVVPTFTWQAYNRRGGDTWYVCSCVHTVDLTRPYLDGGVPYNFGQYDRNLFRWLARNQVRVDVLADQDLNRIATGIELRHLYRMVVFESHGEYVTSHMFDITEQYRNLGGHLAFLSANDFFREVVISGDSMTLIGRFRDLGRPEAALIGAQYIDWYRNRYPNQPYRVVGAGRVPWLFARTGLKDGSLIPGYYGIEIDGATPASPPGTTVVATIPNIFPGETADMTYYTTAAGAEVFDAGTINFGGAAADPYVATMLTNLWAHMSGMTSPLPSRPTSPSRARGHRLNRDDRRA